MQRQLSLGCAFADWMPLGCRGVLKRPTGKATVLVKIPVSIPPVAAAVLAGLCCAVDSMHVPPICGGVTDWTLSCVVAEGQVLVL
jgi:hypothetical protein